MTKSIPSFLTSLYFALMIFLSGFLLLTTYHKLYDEAFSGKHIGIVLIYLIFPTLLVFLILKWKIVLVKEKNIDIIYPLKFKKNRIENSQIKSINWRLWGNSRSPDFRIMDIVTNSNKKITISDLEFQNFDSLETAILNNSKLKINLSRSEKIKYEQAKFNLIMTIGFLILSALIGFMSLKTILNNHKFDNKLFVTLIVSTLVFMSYVFQLFEYLKRLNKKPKL
jgi:hypothetical protein